MEINGQNGNQYQLVGVLRAFLIGQKSTSQSLITNAVARRLFAVETAGGNLLD